MGSISPTSMRRLFCLLCVLALGACTSSREAASGPGYAITRNDDGSTTIAVDPEHEGALMAALMAAAGQIEESPSWTPPEQTADLERIETVDLGASGTGYRYRFAPGRLDVYVYRTDMDVEQQVADTERSLAVLVQQGRLVDFERVGETEQTVSWRECETTLYRVAFEEKMDGATWDSYMYLLRDGAHWIKVRASYPRKALDVAELDAVVRALLGV